MLIVLSQFVAAWREEGEENLVLFFLALVPFDDGAGLLKFANRRAMHPNDRGSMVYCLLYLLKQTFLAIVKKLGFRVEAAYNSCDSKIGTYANII